MSYRHSPKRTSLAVIFFLFLSFASLLLAANFHRLRQWFSQASGTPANLVINLDAVNGPMPAPWKNLAQGGESASYRFQPIVSQIKSLTPDYVRVDHFYDYYHVVSRDPQGVLHYNWSEVDDMLQGILESGALPFISLSYTPPILSSGTLTDPPVNWAEWQDLVRATVEHVSGVKGLNLPFVYYEVWNEPDLFGDWKTYGDKNYLTLYYHTAQGALAAKNVQPYKIGGPATTGFYPNWFTRLLAFVSQNNLPLDFYSWHRYHSNPRAYVQDLAQFQSLLKRYPQYALALEPVISEWGPNSELDPAYDTPLGAAHTVAVMSVLTPGVSRAFSFEIQDGVDPHGQTFWGRWGLLTSPQSGNLTKPRYHALRFLNRLQGTQLTLAGQGSWVTGLASLNETGEVQLILANYDPASRHHELVPLTFLQLQPGTYQLTQEFLGGSPTTFNLLANPSLTHQVAMPPNSVVSLTLKFLSSTASSTLP